MTTVNIAQLKNGLSELLRRVERGEQVIIARRNVPFATVVPLPRARRNRTRLGCLPGSVEIAGDLIEPAIPESDWSMHSE